MLLVLGLRTSIDGNKTINRCPIFIIKYKVGIDKEGNKF